MTALFLRLLPYDDKAAALTEAVAAVREGKNATPVVHTVDPASVRQAPSSPFAYWVGECIRRLFIELPQFESQGREFHRKPDPNDGLILNIAPFHELVPWKEAKSYWGELLAGKYEWSSIGKQLRERELVQ